MKKISALPIKQDGDSDWEGVLIMFNAIGEFIKFLKKNQEENERFAKIVQGAVVFYLLFASVWSLCYVVGDLFSAWGIA